MFLKFVLIQVTSKMNKTETKNITSAKNAATIAIDIDTTVNKNFKSHGFLWLRPAPYHRRISKVSRFREFFFLISYVYSYIWSVSINHPTFFLGLKHLSDKSIFSTLVSLKSLLDLIVKKTGAINGWNETFRSFWTMQHVCNKASSTLIHGCSFFLFFIFYNMIRNLASGETLSMHGLK